MNALAITDSMWPRENLAIQPLNVNNYHLAENRMIPLSRVTQHDPLYSKDGLNVSKVPALIRVFWMPDDTFKPMAARRGSV